MAPMVHSPMFNDLVAQSIVARTSIEKDDIIILDNSAKYDPDGIKGTHEDSVDDQNTLAAIFDTMATINHLAVESDTLCTGPHGGASFRDALFRATDKIASLAAGRSIRFVELGPEPWKSSAMLKRLLRPGSSVRLHQYIGLDINPESEPVMRSVLEPTIGADRFTYWVQDFYHASAKEYPPPPGCGEEKHEREDVITVVANLGFQEGNDLPSRIGPMLASLTQPGDLVISEMQVYEEQVGEANADIIRGFYLHPEMRRFSALVGQKFDKSWRSQINGTATRDVESPASDTDSDDRRILEEESQGDKYLYNLVPLATEVGNVNVATTLVLVRPDGTDKYVLTNSCLKYSRDQFARAREVTGKFAVRCVEETGDGSVLFQIASRI